MVAIAPDAAASTKDAVDGTRKTDRESTDTGDQARMIVRLDDQMNMIALNAELNDAEATAR